jgi:2-iminoacetate synthase
MLEGSTHRQHAPDSGAEAATEQFSISDDRDPRTVQTVLHRMGLEPVWKDWDEAILSEA